MSVTSANEPCRIPCGFGVRSSDRTRLQRTVGRLRRLGTQLREIHADQVEAQERLLLINMPWREEYLHWSGDGGGHLHGAVAPSHGWRRLSVTGSGWCPGLREP